MGETDWYEFVWRVSDEPHSEWGTGEYWTMDIEADPVDALRRRSVDDLRFGPHREPHGRNGGAQRHSCRARSKPWREISAKRGRSRPNSPWRSTGAGRTGPVGSG